MLNLLCIASFKLVPNHRQKYVASRNKNELINNLAVKAGDLLIQYVRIRLYRVKPKVMYFQMNS